MPSAQFKRVLGDDACTSEWIVAHSDIDQTITRLSPGHINFYLMSCVDTDPGLQVHSPSNPTRFLRSLTIVPHGRTLKLIGCSAAVYTGNLVLVRLERQKLCYATLVLPRPQGDATNN